MGEYLTPGSPEALACAQLLEQMACIYPGDPTGALARDACELRGIPYDPPVFTITYDDEPRP